MSITDYIDLSSEEWNGFTYIKSIKAFEEYKCNDQNVFGSCVRVKNKKYGFRGENKSALINHFLDFIRKLADIARANIAEGNDFGQGTLILQSRTGVTITKNEEDGKLDICWRGGLERIPENYRHTPIG